MTYEPKEREILDQVVAALHGHYGERLSRVVLFGSRARRDHEPDSDFDVLVVMKGEVERATERKSLGDLIYPIDLAEDAVVCCHAVEEHRFQHERSAFMLNVRKEGVSLLGTPNSDISVTLPPHAEELHGHLALARQHTSAAKNLASDATFVRFAVGHCYLAIFHCATALLLSKGLHFSKQAEVISAFGAEFSQRGVFPPKMHAHFEEAFLLRDEADSALRPDISMDVYNRMLQHAEEFIARTEAYLNQQP